LKPRGGRKKRRGAVPLMLRGGGGKTGCTARIVHPEGEGERETVFDGDPAWKGNWIIRKDVYFARKGGGGPWRGFDSKG